MARLDAQHFFSKLALILSDFDDSGKNRPQETPDSRCPLWVLRNTNGFGRPAES
jgi:hypothetical protein